MNMETTQEGYLTIDSSLYKTRFSKKYGKRKAYVPADPGKILSYIPGTVLEIFVTPGTSVVPGQDLMIIDAMKMKNRIKCSISGTVKQVTVSLGARVGKGDVLVEIR